MPMFNVSQGLARQSSCIYALGSQVRKPYCWNRLFRDWPVANPSSRSAPGTPVYDPLKLNAPCGELLSPIVARRRIKPKPKRMLCAPLVHVRLPEYSKPVSYSNNGMNVVSPMVGYDGVPFCPLTVNRTSPDEPTPVSA